MAGPPEADSLARNFFGTRFQLATDAEQRYLVVMDSLGDPPYGSSDIVRAYGAKDQRGVSIHRDALIQKGITWAPRRGRLDFTVPSSRSTCARIIRFRRSAKASFEPLSTSADGIGSPTRSPTSAASDLRC